MRCMAYVQVPPAAWWHHNEGWLALSPPFGAPLGIGTGYQIPQGAGALKPCQAHIQLRANNYLAKRLGRTPCHPC